MVAARERTSDRPSAGRQDAARPPLRIDPPRPHLWFLIVSGVLLAGWMGFLIWLAWRSA